MSWYVSNLPIFLSQNMVTCCSLLDVYTDVGIIYVSEAGEVSPNGYIRVYSGHYEMRNRSKSYKLQIFTKKIYNEEYYLLAYNAVWC
jgi:hypothetical protein